MSPTYVYFCEACKGEVEEMFSVSQAPDFVSCPYCNLPAAKQISGGQGFILKGTNWARDKYTGQSNLRFRKVNDKGEME